MTVFDETRLPHTSTFMTLKRHNATLLVSNFDLVFYNAMEELCENCRSIALY